MAKNEKRVKVTLACEVCKRRNYITMKNKVNDRERIEMSKYCAWDRHHTLHKETALSVVDPVPTVGTDLAPPDVTAVEPSRPRRRAATRLRAGGPPGRLDLAGLVAAARGGDPDALDALVRATYADTYVLAYRLTGNDDDARDVVQDAYLRAHRGLPRFRGDAQFTTWLYRITVNSASTTVHKRHRTRTEVLADDAPVVESRPERDPEWRATSAEDRTIVAAALAALPGRLRQVVVFRDIYDLPHKAIADELGISEAAAKVRLHRARRRLKDALQVAPGVGGEGREGGPRDRAR